MVDWFLKHSVPSISPQTSMFLLEVSTKVQAEVNKDPDTPSAIKAYVTALHMVATAGHIHQGIVIAQLSRALQKPDKTERAKG